ncbi:Alpha-2-macroglobulin [Armadillidium vulgare]|nr:Alpha-2-macroglobulin [Armadillidium vulgare]
MKEEFAESIPSPAPSLENAEAAVFAPNKVGAALEEESIQERSYLPETWLWLLRTLSETGELNEVMTLPDTITEWVGNAVCIHPEEGVGISQTSSIITFTSFFLDLTLPSTAVRGEVLPIIISIFNYLDEDLAVKVFIEESENYEFVEGESGEREVCVPARSSATESVRVNLIKLGQVNVTAEATSEPSLSSGSCGSGSFVSKSDRLIKPLLVEAEGYLRERVFTEYICTEDIEDTTSPVATWSISVPEEAVEDSGRAWITAVGDLLGPTIENLGELVRMPYGCGEQNMINFAPIIYILQYLESSDQNDPELKEKLIGFLNEGYQRQLKFKRSDGSYSTFGESDKDGSTWLTAFVVKSFTQALPYTFIDEESLQESRDWLLDLQGEDGCFEARGRVVNKMLQGGFSGSEGSKGLLAAYVLASLLEGGSLSNETEGSNRQSTVTQLALQCIATDNSTHPYSLALKSYSLALAKAPNTKAVIDQLLDLSVSNSSMLRWSLPDRSGQSTPLHVETAAYALLSIITFDYEQYQEEAKKIVRWLSSQMNGQGGFIFNSRHCRSFASSIRFRREATEGEFEYECGSVSC